MCGLHDFGFGSRAWPLLGQEGVRQAAVEAKRQSLEDVYLHIFLSFDGRRWAAWSKDGFGWSCWSTASIWSMGLYHLAG
jgi:hypothetical protein